MAEGPPTAWSWESTWVQLASQIHITHARAYAGFLTHILMHAHIHALTHSGSHTPTHVLHVHMLTQLYMRVLTHMDLE